MQTVMQDGQDTVRGIYELWQTALPETAEEHLNHALELYRSLPFELRRGDPDHGAESVELADVFIHLLERSNSAELSELMRGEYGAERFVPALLEWVEAQGYIEGLALMVLGRSVTPPAVANAARRVLISMGPPSVLSRVSDEEEEESADMLKAG
jgi:hypothetical protein